MQMSRVKAALVWIGLVVAIAVPLGIAATSPLLAWREPVYTAAGLAGVVSLSFLLVQPLLASGVLPGLPLRPGRRVHTIGGGLLVGAVILHVVGLWITSPPDVVDALLFRSATPFSAWGVIAMWAIFVAALLAVVRRRMRPRHWRMGHTMAVSFAVIGTVVHAILIEGTMGMMSKVALCAFVVCAMVIAIRDLRTWRLVRWPGA